jgi:arylsulfatase A-like enzyme
MFNPAKTTLASLLKDQGYATAALGKWHLGWGKGIPNWNGELKPGPREVGFDYYFGVPCNTGAPPYVYVENDRVVGLDRADPMVFGPAAKKNPAHTKPYPEKHQLDLIGGARAAHELFRDEEHCTKLTAKAQDWIREHKDRPFFLYYASLANHHPFTPAPRFQGSSACGPYGDYLQELDWSVGEVMRTLDECNLRDNTLVILTSDNGGMLNAGGQEAWRAGHRLNADLLGFKFDVWEGGHRVPLILRWPGRIEAGSVSGQLVCHVDFLATFAAMTGAKLGTNDGIDSQNVFAAWTGAPDKTVREFVILAPNKKTHLSIRSGNWIYIPAQGGGGWTAESGHLLGGPAALKFAGEINSDIQDGKIVPGAPPEQLYDLAADPSQRTNVIREHPAVADHLRGLLKKYQDESALQQSLRPDKPRRKKPRAP